MLHAVGSAGDTQISVGCVRFHHAGGVHAGLRLNHSGDAVDIKAKAGQLIGLHLDEDFFRLNAHKLHLFYVGHAIKIQLNFFGILAQILIGKAVLRASEGINIAINIVKAVVIIGAIGAGGQLTFGIVNDIAQLQPALAYAIARNLVAQRYGDNTGAGAGIAGDVVNLRQVLHFFFNRIGEVLFHLLSAGTGPGGGDDHLLHGKVGVLAATE